MRRVLHLVRRFCVSLRRRTASEFDLSWVEAHLTTGEWQLFEQMSGSDQAHSVDVARRVAAALGETASFAVLAAALMHDVGKIEADSGVAIRVVATLVEPVVPDSTVERWRHRSGPVGKLARQLGYPEAGHRLLTNAGSADIVAAWAREHHLSSKQWSVPLGVGDVLRRADEAAS
ncbi:MAG: hypothetical protein ACI8Y4_000333 [Candidatus Poriferisodalaceae bacterium]|jgi:hypothetical protein